MLSSYKPYAPPPNRRDFFHRMEMIAEQYVVDPAIKGKRELSATLLPRFVEEMPEEAFEYTSPAEQGIFFFSTEVEDAACMMMQEALVNAHLNLPAGQAINLYVNSPGGECFSGLSLISAILNIRREGRDVNIHVQAFAASMASFLVQAASWRTIEAHGTMMLHEIAVEEFGKTSDVKEAHAFNIRLQDTLYGMYANRTGRPVEYWRDRLEHHDVYLLAEECLELGLVDEILGNPEDYRGGETPIRLAADALPVPSKQPRKRRTTK